MNNIPSLDIKAIIGLGNPGPRFYHTRHNIGFQIVDALADSYDISWQTKDNMEISHLTTDNKKVIIIKPQTFMNNSGKVISFLTKQGVKPENILVIHDELEQPFGAVKLRFGGSARGHNGLKSIIAACGDQFARLRVGIGRPANKEDVPDYVLEKFQETPEQVAVVIDQALTLMKTVL